MSKYATLDSTNWYNSERLFESIDSIWLIRLEAAAYEQETNRPLAA